MLSLLIGFILATGGVSSDAVQNEDSVAVSFHAPMPAPAQQASNYQSAFLPTQNGRIWLNFGWARVTSVFDNDGDRVDIGIEGGDSNLTTLALNVGGLYTFYRIGDMNLNAGINFAMANRQLNIGDPFDTEFSSGFAPQNLTVFGEIERPMYSLRLGYLADLGPEVDAGEGDIENTDRQSAMQFGASTEHWTGNVRLFGGADYFLTFPREEEGFDVDFGDVINLNAGAGWNWGAGEVGLALLYRIRTEGSIDPDVGPGFDDEEFDNGWVLSAVPYVNYSPLGSNYQVFLKGALQSEYHDYGFALAGKNDIAPRLGFTLGVNYAL